MKDTYVYPAVFTFEPEGISVEFPDIPGCFSCGDNWENAYEMGKEALALNLYTMEEDKEDIPAPSDIYTLPLEENQRTVLVEVWMPEFRSAQENKPVKKTLTIPSWLNDAAEQNHINFSSLLQEALKNRLNLSDPIHKSRRKA